MARVYVSVGSNVDRERNVRASLHTLRERFGRLQSSRVYQTEAVGFEGEPFYNLVVGFDTDLAPRELVDLLHAIEAAQGRRRDQPSFSDRSLDLDLLLYDDRVMDEPGLVLPRPEILEYAFVLGPLAELAGELRHPVLGQSYRALWEAFDASGQAMRPVEL
ncbi:MAG TPA: 2-amino-4-hydroxy-6-hydroxymethyldihydropteridine diphosphokinase [Gammaproteobacteria bacterium]|nr:2-amino-4-hydroxy-6-hydroxymethyldihydropteridine diphosphokinase [Gammaproteobacteria bacterium]